MAITNGCDRRAFIAQTSALLATTSLPPRAEYDGGAQCHEVSGQVSGE